MSAEQSTIVFFRFSISIFIGSISFFACLIGKFLKEKDLIYYSYFHTSCCGILLAKGFADIFFLQKEEINSITAALLVSSTFLILYVAKTVLIPSKYEYNPVANMDLDLDEDDEDLGIEVSDNVPPYLQNREEENALEEGREVGMSVDREASQQQKLSWVWFLSVLLAVVGNEIGKGVVLGSEQHATIASYEPALFDGVLLALTFGVVCEEALNSSTYLVSVMIFVASKPFGVILGNFLVHDKVVTACNWIALIASGVYLSFVVFHMIPANERLNEANLDDSQRNKLDRRASTAIRVTVFIFAYLFTLFSQFIFAYVITFVS